MAAAIAGCEKQPTLPVPAANLPRITFPVADASKSETRLKLNQPIPAGKEVAFVIPITGANDLIEPVRSAVFVVRQPHSAGFHHVKGGYLFQQTKEGDTIVLGNAVGPVTPRSKGPVIITVTSTGNETPRKLAEYEAEYQ